MKEKDLSFSEAISDLIKKELESITKGSSEDLADFKLEKGNPIKQLYRELMVIKAKIESIQDEEARRAYIEEWTALEDTFANLAKDLSVLGDIKDLKELFNPSKEQKKAMQADKEASSKLKKLMKSLSKKIKSLVEKYNGYHYDNPIGRYDEIKFEIPSGKNFMGLLGGELLLYRKDKKGQPVFMERVYDEAPYRAKAEKKYGKALEEDTPESEAVMDKRMSKVEEEMIAAFGDVRTFPHKNKHLSVGNPVKESANGGAAKYSSTDPIEVRKLEHYARMYGWVTSSGENVHKFPFVVGADQGEETSCVRIDGDHGHPIVESGAKTSFETYIRKDWEDKATQKDPERKEALKKYLRRVGYAGVHFNWKDFTWDTNVRAQGRSFTIGSSSGEGLNCLIDSIRLALGLNHTAEDIAAIRTELITAGLANEHEFLYNDQQVLEAILVGLGQNPNNVNIFFVAGDLIDNFTYNFNGATTIYIHNAGNVHFSPMEEA